MAANSRERTSRNPKRSWAYLNDICSTGALANEGDRKRKRDVASVKKLRKKAIFASVEDISSSVTQKQVRRIFETANISSDDYEFLVPSKSQRASRPPQGYITVYEEQITAGLRFPMHDMIERVCDFIQLSPSQLAPHAYRVIVGFILCAKFYEIPVTEASFFSLVKVISVKTKGLFTFRPIRGNNFLEDKPSSNGLWRKKFFFLRRKGISWNCITEWRETCLRPTPDDLLAEAAIEKGIMNHRFRVNELACKEILVHGGIEPGVPSPKFTFRFLMHKAAVTKFDLLPEDKPPVRATNRKTRTIRLKITSSTTPTAAHTNPPTLKPCAASLAQPSNDLIVNHQQLLPTPNDTEIPSATAPICEHLPASSEDNIPLNDPHAREYTNQESESCEARTEANSTVPVLDEAEHQPIPPGLLTLWQNIELKYVPKDHYQELEKDLEKLSSELTYTKWQNQELKKELEMSKARSVEYEKRISAAHESMKNLEESAKDIRRIRDSELACKESRIQELVLQLEVSEGKRADSEKKICLASEDKKRLEILVEDIQSDLNRIRDSELACKESQIQELVLQLEVSEAKRTDSEKKTRMAYEDMKNLEKSAENIHRIIGSQLESTKSRILELERELEVSEKLTNFACEDIENLKKSLDNSQRIRDSELARAKSEIEELELALAIAEATGAASEKKIDLVNEDKKQLEKRIEDLNSDFERNRDKIRKDAIEEFKSSDEFLNIVQEKATTYFDDFDSKYLNID